MGFKLNNLAGKNIKRVLHIGAYTGEELSEYANIGVNEIVWIEANPYIYNELVENLSKSNHGINNISFNSLVSDKDGEETDFHLYYYNDNRGMSSILKMVSGCAGQTSAEDVHRMFYKETLKLTSITVNSLLEQNNISFDFDFLNMDTQGAELLISKGATKVIENVRYINSEVTFFAHDYENGVYFDELYDFFKQYGFVHTASDLSGDQSWGDAFFERNV